MHHIKVSKGIVFAVVFLFCIITVVPLPANSAMYHQTIETTEHPLSFDTTDALFDQKISLFMKLARFPSLSACIIKGDQIVWSKGYGYYDLEQQKPATTDTIYVIASITKTIVGTALMQLYDQGLFDLDEDVNTYLPFELRNPYFPDDPITFRMLLSHTSSLNSNTQMEYYWFNFSGDPPFDFFPDPYLKEFLVPGGRYYSPTVWSDIHRPGEHAMYANVGFDLISYLVEIISGEPFLDYCDTHIFHPLHMDNTSFNLSTLDIDQVAIPYQCHRGRYYKINELTFIFGEQTPPGQYWRGRFYPAGGLYTTVNDLSHFFIAHMNDGVYQDTRILKKETVDLMHDIQPGNDIHYGLAWMQITLGGGLKVSGHGGDIFGVDTWMLYNSSDETGVIYFANGNPAYGSTPFIGWLTVRLLLQSLFTEGGSLSINTFISPMDLPYALSHQPLL